MERSYFNILQRLHRLLAIR